MHNRIFFKMLLWGQFFVFTILLAVGLYLFAVSQSSRTDSDLVPRMQTNSAICLLLSPLWLVPTIGIRRKSSWAWWVGFTVNLAACVLLAWALGFGTSDVDTSAYTFPGTFFILTILHLLSRPTNWKAMEFSQYTGFARKTT